jgi:hypothetical protein
VIAPSPTLLALYLRRSSERADRTAQLPAEREGLDVNHCPRPGWRWQPSPE